MTEPRLIGPSLDGVHPIFFPESVPSALPPECHPASEIDAAIEQVVKTGSDPGALAEAVRMLAGLLGYDLEAQAVGDLPLIVHGSHGGGVMLVEGDTVYVAPCGYYSPLMSMTGLFSAINCPGCLEALA
jgi:hypothetical protein